MVVGHIRCEIRNGVIKALVFPEVQWLKTWGAVVKLTLTRDERSDLDPSVSVLVRFRMRHHLFSAQICPARHMQLVSRR